MEFKILYLYPDIMDLYGDSGNISVLEYRLNERGINVVVDTYTVDEDVPNFSNYDLVFSGGGPDIEQEIMSEDLIRLKKNIKKSIEEGVFYLLICGSYQLFGSHYLDSNKKKLKGINIFDFYTKASSNKKERCIGNTIIETDLNNSKIKIIGFSNHGGETFNVKKPFGKVLCGYGNYFDSKYEGFFIKNVIGTYLHGPLLSKNPVLADYIIKYALDRKYKKNVELKKIDDSLEEKCQLILFDRLLK